MWVVYHTHVKRRERPSHLIPLLRPAVHDICRLVYGDFQIMFLDVLQLTRHHKNIIDNESNAFSNLRWATREQ